MLALFVVILSRLLEFKLIRAFDCIWPQMDAAVESCRLLTLRTMLLVSTTVVSGCTVVSSYSLTELAEAGREPRGTRYSLPVGVLKVNLHIRAAKAEYRITYDEPTFLPSKEHRWLMQYRPLPQYSDDVLISTSPNSLLNSVHTTTTDQTATIIQNLANTLARQFLSTTNTRKPPADFVKIGSALVDPAKSSSVNSAVRDFKSRVKDTAKQYYQQECNRRTPQSETCRRYAVIINGGWRKISIVVKKPQLPRPVDKPDCRQGLCYRARAPFLIRHKLPGGSGTHLALLPNSSPVIHLDFRRAMLVTKVHKVTFDENGFLSEVKITRPSELEALSAIPYNILNGLSDILPLHFRIIEEQVKIRNAELDLLEAQKSFEETASGDKK